MYGGPGDDCTLQLQKQILEEGTFSDLVIKTQNPENKKNPKLFKCHRQKLAESSQYFANMLQGDWTEAHTRTISLPLSEEAIEAMLHYIYFRGTEGIYKSYEDYGHGVLLLELLQAGHMYNMEKLVDLVVFVLSTNDVTSKWLSVETALETFSFARKMEGQVWAELREKCCWVVFRNEQDQLTQSKIWNEMTEIAKKLGLGFVALLDHFSKGTDVEITCRELLPGSLDGVEGVKKEDAELFYDFMMSSGNITSAEQEFAVGLFVLAKYLGKPVKEVVEKCKWLMTPSNLNGSYYSYPVESLVDLYSLATNREGEFWMQIKTAVLLRLIEYKIMRPDKLEESQKFKEIIQGNEEVAEELILFEEMYLLEESEEEDQINGGESEEEEDQINGGDSEEEGQMDETDLVYWMDGMDSEDLMDGTDLVSEDPMVGTDSEDDQINGGDSEEDDQINGGDSEEEEDDQMDDDSEEDADN